MSFSHVSRICLSIDITPLYWYFLVLSLCLSLCLTLCLSLSIPLFQRKRHYWRLDSKCITLFQSDTGNKYYKVRGNDITCCLSLFLIFCYQPLVLSSPLLSSTPPSCRRSPSQRSCPLNLLRMSLFSLMEPILTVLKSPLRPWCTTWVRTCRGRSRLWAAVVFWWGLQETVEGDAICGVSHFVKSSLT